MKQSYNTILDPTLSYKFHLTKTASKVKTKNNIIQKLVGSNWGASSETLRISALALVFPVAEYCCSAWIDSCHSKLIDVQLNNTMQIITGTLKATKNIWLPVLCNIAPPDLKRRNITKKLFKNCNFYHKIHCFMKQFIKIFHVQTEVQESHLESFDIQLEGLNR